MEEEKAAAYYDELTRKGGGASRFKQGLGFSSSSTSENDIAPKKHASSSSSLSNFVKASSSDATSDSNLQKQSQLESIQNKLKKKPTVEKDRDRDHKERERERDRNRSYRGDRSRVRERDYRDRDREEDGDRERNYRDRDKERAEERERGRRRRSRSPRRERTGVEKERGGKVDYSRLIKGYDRMTPAERVKAQMKLQLAKTAEKDDSKGSGWERFEFNKDAPLDDEEIEIAEDDATLVKHIGQSFRFSAIEARREEQIKAAHDEAMFGASAVPLSVSSDNEPEPDNNEKKCNDSALTANLFSETVLARQQGSWRERARKA